MSAWMRRWSAPWLWSTQGQVWGCWCLFLLACGGDWLLQGEGEALLRVRQQQTQHAHVLQSIQTIQTDLRATQQALERIGQDVQPFNSNALPHLMQSFKTSALDAGLQVPVMTLHQTSQSSKASQVQFEVRGPYANVWRWWQKVQAESLDLVLQQLDMVNAHSDLHIKGTWQWVPNDVTANANSLKAPPHLMAQHIGFDHATWLQTQRWHAQQTPSYVQWVLPEVKRLPQTLEQYALDDLRFDGVISQANKQRALVRVVNAAAALQPWVLLAEGAYLGRDHGRLHTITAEHLLVREVVQNAQGEWAPRWVKLPLSRALDAPLSRRSGP